MLDISKQAYIYTIILFVTALINLVVTGFVFGISGFLIYILIFIIGIPILLFSIYNIDCLTTGGCEAWSWFVSIISCISLSMTTILMVFLGLTNQTIKVSVGFK